MSDTANGGLKAHNEGLGLSRLDWSVVLGIGGMHIAALAAPFYFSWSGLLVAFVIYWMVGGFGITLCYHRLLTHRSFKTPKWFEYILALIGCLAWQGGPVQWVGIHRIHHQHSDQDLDPHTPNHGFTWSHMFWCMFHEQEGREGVDAAKDLMRDPGLRLINKFFWVPQIVLGALLYVGGEFAASQGWVAVGAGMSWLIWGVAVRIVVGYHGTWLVNSASHTWGYRNFETTDRSTNNWWVALLSFGEGWHNNHHAFQRSAAHGLRWYEFDVTYLTIRFLGLIGLATDIKLPDRDKLEMDGVVGPSSSQPKTDAKPAVGNDMPVGAAHLQSDAR